MRSSTSRSASPLLRWWSESEGCKPAPTSARAVASQDGVAVIKQCVCAVDVALASKAGAEKGREVALRGLRFQIGGIAGAHARRHRAAASDRRPFVEGRRLREDFRPRQFRPQALAQRQARGGLRLDPIALGMMAVDGQEVADRAKIRAADHQRRATRGERRDRLRRQAGGGVGEDHRLDVVERRLADAPLRAGDFEKAARQRQPAPFAGDLHDLTQHGAASPGSSPKAGRKSARDEGSRSSCAFLRPARCARRLLAGGAFQRGRDGPVATHTLNPS